MYSDRKHISGCLGMQGGAAGKQKGEIIKGQKETFEGDGHVHYLGCSNNFMVYTYIMLTKL